MVWHHESWLILAPSYFYVGKNVFAASLLFSERVSGRLTHLVRNGASCRPCAPNGRGPTHTNTHTRTHTHTHSTPTRSLQGRTGLRPDRSVHTYQHSSRAQDTRRTRVKESDRAASPPPSLNYRSLGASNREKVWTFPLFPLSVRDSLF